MTGANGNLNPALHKENDKRYDTMSSVNSSTSFLKNIFIASFIAVLVSIYPVYVYCTKVQIYSYITGYLISLMNAMIGYGMNEMAFKKSVKGFMFIVFGGIGIRIILVGLFLLITLEFTSLNAVSLVSSVFIFYVLFMALEIYYLHKKQASAIQNEPSLEEK